jgi:bifunctional non-homologous end joining protein LigD
MSAIAVAVNGRELSLSNPDKDLYPSYGFTKSRIVEYYGLMARFILPFIKDRALTLKRYPDGVGREFFFEKRCPRYRPAWVETAEIPYGDGKKITCCLANNLETLIWVENLASIELHVPMARVGSPGNPDSMVFDLDPGVGADVLDCARVAIIVRDLLVGMKLSSFVKTSGKKGLHVCVPLDSDKTKFDDTKKFSKAVADIVQKNYPDLVTAKMARELRINKVFINWSQNDASKTMVGVYSLRAEEKPTVSFPFSWDDVEKLERRGDPKGFQVLAPEAIKTVEKKGAFFKGMLNNKQRLPAL